MKRERTPTLSTNTVVHYLLSAAKATAEATSITSSRISPEHGGKRTGRGEGVRKKRF